jgi:hypothetical protein
MPVTIQSAESNRAVLRAIPESTWGTTPGTGSTRELRLTSSSLVPSKETVVSEELRADRMVSSIVEVAASVGGSLNGEFSAGTNDDFLQSFLLGAWSKPMTFDAFSGSNVSITSTSQITVAGVADLTKYFTSGRPIKLEGFTEKSNNGYFTLSGVAGSVLTVSGTPLTVEAGSASTKVLDANDVILTSTAVQFGTGGAATIDGGGGSTVFQTAIGNGQLRVGQKIFVDGLGYEQEASTVATNPAAGETWTITDSDDTDIAKTVVFEFNSSAAAVTAGNVYVEIGGTVADTADNLAAACMAQFAAGNTAVYAESDGVDEVTFTNSNGTGGTITDGTGGNLTGTTFAGGDASLHGVFTILAVSNDALTVDRAPTTDANSGSVAITIKGSHLRNEGDFANITKQSYTIETGFTDIDKYFVKRGQRVGSFGMNVAAGEIATINFDFMGRDVYTSVTSILGDTGTYTVLQSHTTEVMNATDNVGNIFKNGTALSSALQSIELSGEASLREQRAVSSKFPAGIGYGRFNLTGTVVAYFDTLDFFNDFLNHTTVELAFNMEDVGKNTYYFTLPAVKFTSDPIAPGGIDQDVMEELEFTAFRDATYETQFMIDRFSSVKPTSKL